MPLPPWLIPPKEPITGWEGRLWGLLTHLGGMPATLFLACGGFAWSRDAGWRMVGSAIALFILANLVKSVYFKPRPDNPQGVRPPILFHPWDLRAYLPGFTPLSRIPAHLMAGFLWVDASSFPSVHSARAFNLAFLYSILMPPWGTSSGFRWAWIAGVWIVAALVAYSRIRKRRHDLADVFGGLVFGLIVGTKSVLWT